MNYKDYIASVENFPKEGIIFRDITPLIRDKEAFSSCIGLIAEYGKKVEATVVVGPEARGFIFGAPVAYALNLGFSPVRKPGKLPREVVSANYDLEYGSNTLCLLKDAIKPGDRVLIVDDLLATGGTVKATCELIEALGGKVAGIACPIELPALKARELLKEYDIFTIMEFDGD